MQTNEFPVVGDEIEAVNLKNANEKFKFKVSKF